MSARRHRVLFVTSWYPTKSKPVEGVFVREHAKAAGRFDDIAVLHLAGRDAAANGIWRLEVERDERVSEGIPTYRLFYRNSPIPWTTYPFFLWCAVRAVRRIASGGFRPDVIHAHVYSSAVAATLIGLVLGCPVVITEHSSAFARGSLSQLAILKTRISFRRASMVLPVSHALRGTIEHFGIGANYRVIPNAVDRELFHPSGENRPAGEKRILFAGLLDAAHIKGVPVLLRAASELKPRRSDWRLRIVGDGPARAEYERMTFDLGLTGCVEFAGLKNRSEVAEEMRRADLFVLPSLWEGLPCVLMEAQASGLPVVASRVGGIPEVVLEGTGELIPPGDAPALAGALDRLLDRVGTIDPAPIVRASERFDPAVVGRQLHEVYESVTGCGDHPVLARNRPASPRPSLDRGQP